MIKAAINGVRMNNYHPLLPFSAEQAADESARCVSAGAEAIHVHVWNKDKESLHPEDVAFFLNATRSVCPDTPVGISTGAWIVPNLDKRLQLIEAWHILPNFVSLNIGEAGFERIASILLNKGVGIEAGISDADEAKLFSTWHDKDKCLRILLEPVEATMEAATTTVKMVETILDDTDSNLPRLLHGLDETTWAMVELAAKRGYDTRIGFEDSVTLPDGKVAESNAQLVSAAFSVMHRYAA